MSSEVDRGTFPLPVKHDIDLESWNQCRVRRTIHTMAAVRVGRRAIGHPGVKIMGGHEAIVVRIVVVRLKVEVLLNTSRDGGRELVSIRALEEALQSVAGSYGVRLDVVRRFPATKAPVGVHRRIDEGRPNSDAQLDVEALSVKNGSPASGSGDRTGRSPPLLLPPLKAASQLLRS